MKLEKRNGLIYVNDVEIKSNRELAHVVHMELFKDKDIKCGIIDNYDYVFFKIHNLRVKLGYNSKLLSFDVKVFEQQIIDIVEKMSNLYLEYKELKKTDVSIDIDIKNIFEEIQNKT
jgi:hypothetical protein